MKDLAYGLAKIDHSSVVVRTANHFRVHSRRFVVIGRRLSCFGLAAILALPVLGRTQAGLPQPLSPSTTIFLADPQLGVAGAYQSGGRTLCFEARTPEQSTQMSARLLDAAGRTIAISGHSMDTHWLANTDFDANSAAQSLSLAGALPGVLTKELDNAVFAREVAALSNLAAGAVQALPATTATTIDAAAADIPSLDPATIAAANRYDAAAANTLMSARNNAGNLSATFGEIQMESFVENFPDGENDDNATGDLGRTEISARILSSHGASLAQQIGGDDIPEGWDSDKTGMFRPASLDSIDPIQASRDAGNAIRGAALMTRFPSTATPAEVEAIGNLAVILRDESIFPNRASSAMAGPTSNSSPWCGDNCFSTDIQVWNKSLVVVAQHSGTVVLHYSINNQFRRPVLVDSTIFCNHGTCPRSRPMNNACTYRGPWIGAYRFAPHWRITAPPPTPVSGYHSCHKTDYHLYSGKLWPLVHGHNCNDDSWTQVRAIKGESFDIDPSDNPFSDGARCDNHGTLDPRSPGCNE